MTMRVVSNAGPLMVFAKLNVLHVLKHLYQHVLFPYAVYQETVEAGLRHGFEDARTLRLFLQHNRWKPNHVKKMTPALFAEHLDQGEKEAIALALEENAVLLMDEEQGRAVARQCGLKVCGSLGVFVAAYQHSLITDDDLRFYFAEIGSRTDIWINPALCRRVLEQLGL